MLNAHNFVNLVPSKTGQLSWGRRWAWLALLVVLVVAPGIALLVFTPGLAWAVAVAVVINVGVWLFRVAWEAQLADTKRWSKRWLAAFIWLRDWAVLLGFALAVFAVVAAFVARNTGVAIYIAGIGVYVGVGAALRRLRASEPGWGLSASVLILVGVVGVVSLVIATTNSTFRPLIGVLVAVLVAPFGLALLSDVWVKDRNGASSRVAWAVAAVFAGVAGLEFAGIGTLQALLLSITLVVVVALIASRTSHDIVLVLVLILLVWSLQPSEGPVEPDPLPGRRTIIALGDSYMSGEGASEYYKGTNHGDTTNEDANDRNECRRAPTAYPVKARDQLAEEGYHYDLLFLACSGARANNLTRVPQHLGEPTRQWSDRRVPATADQGQAQLPQAAEAIGALDLRPKVVLISIGGNDVGFGEIGQTCGLPGDCSLLGDDWLGAIEEKRVLIRETYQTIKATPALAGSRFVVMPYPVPLNESGCAGSLLQPNEHRFLVGFTRALNKMLEEEARLAKIEFDSGAVDAFTVPRKRICDVSPQNAAVNQLAASPITGVFLQQVSPRGWFHNTFHPNASGHVILGKRVAGWILHPERLTITPPSDAPVTMKGIMGAGFDHCGPSERIPATCHQNREAWKAATTSRMLWAILIPVVLLVLGALQLSVFARLKWPGPGQ